jgi:hypothetical protein
LNCEDGQTCSDSGECTSDGGPGGWTCDPAWFDVGDDCDCNCGIYDPDCDNPALSVVNCDAGQVCNASGSCADPVGPDRDVGVAPDAGEDAGPGPAEDVRGADGVSGPDSSGDTGGVGTGDSGAVLYPTDSGCASTRSKSPDALSLLLFGMLAARRRRAA